MWVWRYRRRRHGALLALSEAGVTVEEMGEDLGREMGIAVGQVRRAAAVLREAERRGAVLACGMFHRVQVPPQKQRQPSKRRAKRARPPRPGSSRWGRGVGRRCCVR